MPSNEERQSGEDGPSESESPIAELNSMSRRALASVVGCPVASMKMTRSNSRRLATHVDLGRVNVMRNGRFVEAVPA